MNMYSASKKSLLVLFGLSVSGIVFSQVEEGGQIEEKAQAKEDKQAIDVDDSYESTMTILGKTDDLKTSAGSANRIDQDELEKFEFDDIHQILSKIPGVNIRQEDGFGLRPNIGFRSATPERSKKINILEDGVLIGPAPYSAPAAYYFPMMSRMSSVEVFKGPSAILYGPNTVVGTINFATRQVSSDNQGGLDIALGEYGYQKGHVYSINNYGDWGFLVEALKVKSDGFKELDTGGDTGFDKNDITAKIRYNLNSVNYQQVFELKLGYADEVSDETYLGLTDDDFNQNPYRRYAASQLDQMEWEHTQIQFNHFLEGDKFDLITRVYRNNFERDWLKLNNFINSFDRPSLQNILQNATGNNEDFYRVLTGEIDSAALSRGRGDLLIGNNGREYYSQGIQSDLRWQVNGLGLVHNIKAGIRYHEDQIERLHDEDNYIMQSSELILRDGTKVITTDNTERSEVWSLYLQDSITLGQWELTGGTRVEIIDSFYENRTAGANDTLSKSETVILPGFTAFYSIDENSGAFAGMHRGFVPASPKQSEDIKFEQSNSLEFGYRYDKDLSKLELVGFYSDIERLIESCTASASSECLNFQRIDESFNSGKVQVYGLEAVAEKSFAINNSIDLPISLTYTYTSAEFKESFRSSFPLWGNVDEGDSVPYLPEQVLALDIGLDSGLWRANLLARYTGEMNEAASDGLDENNQVDLSDAVELAGVTIKSQWILDFSASYDLNELGSVYLKVDNLLDEENLVSRRPYGARPGKPRQFVVGYKYFW
jgi:Fe(3+) dicitrate transport protein